MSVPKSLDRRIACELLAEVQREILANTAAKHYPRKEIDVRFLFALC
jgi:hypothetical protein